jgi:hypothetical protein
MYTFCADEGQGEISYDVFILDKHRFHRTHPLIIVEVATELLQQSATTEPALVLPMLP